MKAYVIKVKDDSYWLGGFYGADNYGDIAHAKIYTSETQAEKQCKLVNESYGHNANVRVVNITEDDLQYEIDNLKLKVKNYQQYKDKVDNDLYNLVIENSKLKEVRKQICDEIRTFIKSESNRYPIICEDENQNIISCISIDSIKNLLSKIEKGENNVD